MSPNSPRSSSLADSLRAAGAAAKKVTVLGTAAGEAITLSTLTLARHLAREARVVVVDLAASSPTIAAVSVDASAPGLAELMQGEASLAQIITQGQAVAASSRHGRPSRLRPQRCCNRRG